MNDIIDERTGSAPGGGASPVPVDDRFAAFRNPRFRAYWLARFASSFAVQIVVTAVGWQIYDLTRSTLDLGIVGLCQFLPSLALFLFTGAAADRWSRRLIMAGSSALEGVGALALLVLTIHGLVSPLPVFAVLVGIGAARAFFGPASQSLVVNLVTRDELANAVAWNSSSWQIATIVGPVAGGLLYGHAAETAYATGFVLFVAGAILALMIGRTARDAEVAAESAAPEPVTLETVAAGFRFIRRQPVVLGAVTLDLFAVLLGGAVALLPAYARDVLHVGEFGLGLLRAAPGVGSLAMAAWLAAHPVRDHAGIVMFGFVALFGAFTVVFGLSTAPWLSILALALMGATDMISVYVRETLIQLWTPDEVRGRVNAVNLLFVGASNELGEFRAGVMAFFIGAVPAVAVGGALTMGVAGLWAWMFPQLRRVRRLAAPE